MKRVILVLVLVGIMLAALGGVGFWFVRAYLWPPIGLADIQKLEENPDKVEPEIQRLVECFAFNNEEVRLHAALALKGAGKKAVEPVCAKLKDSNPRVRFCAVETLGWIGPDAAPAADDVRACLRDDDANVRYKAAYALGRLGVHSESIIEGLALALRDSERDVASTAEDSLKTIGPPAGPKLYQMLDTSKDPDRTQLLTILVAIGPPPKEALPVLAKLSRTFPRDVRYPVLTLLGQLGESAVPTFKEILPSAPRNEYSAYLTPIAALGEHAKPLLPELQTLWVREEELPQLLGIFKKCGPEGARALVGAFRLNKKDEKNIEISNFSSRNPTLVLAAVGEMGWEAKLAVPDLVELLKERKDLRREILETLGSIGPAAKEAGAAVQELAKEDPALEKAALIALRRMGVTAPMEVIEK